MAAPMPDGDIRDFLFVLRPLAHGDEADAFINVWLIAAFIDDDKMR